MSSEFSIIVSPKKEDEPGATEKQISFATQLFDKLNIDEKVVEINSLGKWQASELIDQLIKLKDSGFSVSEPSEIKQKITLITGFGIFVFPYFFCWLTLHPSYSRTARILSFAWLAWSISILYSVLKV